MSATNINTVQLLIEAIVSGQDNKELAIFYNPDEEGFAWEIHMNNPSPAVMLGETNGKYYSQGHTLEAALENLITAKDL